MTDSGGEQLYHRLMEAVCEQLVKSNGLIGVRASHRETLAAVGQEFLREAAARSVRQANSMGRTMPNLDDCILVLADMGTSTSAMIKYVK